MIIRLDGGIENKSTADFLAALEAGGATLNMVQSGPGVWVVVSNLTGDTRAALEQSKLVLERHDPEGEAFFVSRRFQAADTLIGAGTDQIGAGRFQIIAGPCAVESAEQSLKTATFLQGEGIRYFRGGLCKPRTSPYSFQGLGRAGLAIFQTIRERFRLRIVSEALDESCLEMILPHVDVVQVGSRNRQNFSLLKRLGAVDKPILLKRGMAATLDEFLMAAEYVVVHGNPRVILCERGIRTISNHTRNTLDLSAVPYLKKVTHLPVIVDPSHGTGLRDLVRPMARAAAAAGADGIMVEVHPEPGRALSDSMQSISHAEFHRLADEVTQIFRLLDSFRN